MFTEDFREVKAGDPEPGFMRAAVRSPSGTSRTRKKTKKTFPVIDGARYSMPGDWVRVEADGTLVLLGRGSVCINTAGEKVYPEEVEETLKEHADVEDASSLSGCRTTSGGRWSLRSWHSERALSSMRTASRAHARAHLAGYKTPKRVLSRATLGRASNGKADYKMITAYAKSELGID